MEIIKMEDDTLMKIDLLLPIREEIHQIVYQNVSPKKEAE